MKTGISLLTAIFLGVNAHGQEYCKAIAKEVSKDNLVYDFASPFDPIDLPTLRTKRSVSKHPNPELQYDNFFVQMRVEGPLESIYTKDQEGHRVDKVEKGFEVEFDDHTKLKTQFVPINHDITDDRINSVRFVDFKLNPENFRSFATKKVLKITLAGYSKDVQQDSAAVFMQYLRCIADEQP